MESSSSVLGFVARLLALVQNKGWLLTVTNLLQAWFDSSGVCRSICAIFVGSEAWRDSKSYAAIGWYHHVAPRLHRCS
eukprot:3108892-Amphidinium_carterae.1